MNKPRLSKNKSLPSRWRKRGKSYYYRPHPGARHHWDGKVEYCLGQSLAEAHAEFARRIGYEGTLRTVAQLCDRYLLEVVPGKAAATQKSNRLSIARIRGVMGQSDVSAIRPVHLHAYRDRIGERESKKKANLDLEVLSHMFTKSIEWGIRDDHPMTGKKVTKFRLEHRRVLPTEADVLTFLPYLSRKFQLYVALKIWTGRRKGELLRLHRSADVTDRGLRFTDNKSGDELLIPWEPETRAIVQELLTLRDGKRGMYLFSTRDGNPYITADGDTSGFNSVWQRAQKKYREAGGKHFTEHDLRKFRASQLTADQAQRLLNHSTGQTTRRYQVGPKIVEIGSK